MKTSTLQAVELSGEIANLDTSYLQIQVENQPLDLTFFGQLQLSYANGKVTLDRSQTEQTDWMLKFDSVRHCEVEKLERIVIYFYRSVVEICLNGGEKVMTSRFFIRQRTNSVSASRPVTAKIAQVMPMHVLDI